MDMLDIIEEAFDKYDKGKEGFLGKDKLVLFFRDFLKKRGVDNNEGEKIARQYMDMIDMGHSGKLSRKEIY